MRQGAFGSKYCRAWRFNNHPLDLNNSHNVWRFLISHIHTVLYGTGDLALFPTARSMEEKGKEREHGRGKGRWAKQRQKMEREGYGEENQREGKGEDEGENPTGEVKTLKGTRIEMTEKCEVGEENT